jgi:hypothetical protein
MTKFKVIETEKKITEAGKVAPTIGAGFTALTNLASAFGIKTQAISTIKGLYKDFKNIFTAAKTRKYTDDEQKVIKALRGGNFNKFIEAIYNQKFKPQQPQQTTVDKPHQDVGLSDKVNKNESTLTEAISTPELTDEEQNFYSAVGLPKDKTTKTIKKLISYFVQDRSYLNPTNMDAQNFTKYFLQYLGDYSRIMSNPRETDYINGLFVKKEKNQLTPQEEKQLNAWVQGQR